MSLLISVHGEASARALAGPQHRALGTLWAPCPAQALLQSQHSSSPIAKDCLHPSPKTVPGWGLTPTAAPRAPVSKPTSRWHGGWCGARLPQVPPANCCLCLLMPGLGPGSLPSTLQISESFPPPSMPPQEFPSLEQLGRATGRQAAASTSRHPPARPEETTLGPV